MQTLEPVHERSSTGLTLNHENPELETRKSALLHEEEQLKVQLASLEKDLLLQLATAQGNILDNVCIGFSTLFSFFFFSNSLIS
jgi:hypothetical protein